MPKIQTHLREGMILDEFFSSGGGGGILDDKNSDPSLPSPFLFWLN